MNKSTDFIRIDISSGNVRKSISCCQSDSFNRTLSISIVDAGELVLLDDVLWAEIIINKADGHMADNTCVISGNEVQYTLRSTDIAALGTNYAQIMLTFKDGTVLTTTRFEIVVFSKQYDPKVQKSMDEYTSITQQLVKVNEIAETVEADRDIVVSNTSYITNAVTRVNEVDEKCDQVIALEPTIESAVASTTASEENAKVSEDNAASSAISAKASEDAAKLSENNSKISENNADTYKSNAKTSELNAKASENSALASVTNAQNFSDLAHGYELDSKQYAKLSKYYYDQIVIAGGLTLGTTADTAYRGDLGQTAYLHSQEVGNPHQTTYSEVGADQAGAAASALTSAKGYTDQKIADLINGAPETLDTLKEIADAMAESEEVVEALEDAIGSKANQSDLTTHTGNSNIHTTATDKAKWDQITDALSRITVIENALHYPCDPATIQRILKGV